MRPRAALIASKSACDVTPLPALPEALEAPAAEAPAEEAPAEEAPAEEAPAEAEAPEVFTGVIYQVGAKTGNMLIKCDQAQEKYGQEAMIPAAGAGHVPVVETLLKKLEEDQ